MRHSGCSEEVERRGLQPEREALVRSQSGQFVHHAAPHDQMAVLKL